MRKLYISVALAFIMGGLSSCSDFLETSSQSQQTEEVVFANPAFVQNALMGVYSQLTLDQTYSSRMSMFYVTNTDIEATSFTATDYKNDDRRGQSNGFATPANSDLGKSWTEIYRGIERANLIIAKVPGSIAKNAFSDAQKKQMEQYYAEALTLRALFYSDLIKVWGNVPFKTEPTNEDGSNFYLEKTNQDVIYEHLITDLLMAEKLLPWVDEAGAGNPERITRGFAKGLAARLALMRGGYSIRPDKSVNRGADWQKYYQIANEQCKDIMARPYYSLTPSFIQFFKDQCASKINANESMFEVGMGLTNSGEVAYSIGIRMTTNSKFGYGNQAYTTALPNYLYSFDPTDTRRDATVAIYSYDKNAKAQVYDNPYDYRIGKWNLKWANETVLAVNRKATGKVLNGINWVLMRYSDVLLMFAETENELNNGPTPAAKEALKTVRGRAFSASNKAAKVDAYVAALASKEDFFNAIVKERAWEFGGEGIRKFDLVRWGIFLTKINEAREASRALMTNGVAPKKLYYKYSTTSTDEIDMSTVNFYSEFTGDATGYSSKDWIGNLSSKNKTAYIDWLRMYCEGITTDRHVQPIPAQVVNDSNGKIVNEYGY
jgi:starch-binding outer membrane protein, SusD/RagB family